MAHRMYYGLHNILRIIELLSQNHAKRVLTTVELHFNNPSICVTYTLFVTAWVQSEIMKIIAKRSLDLKCTKRHCGSAKQV